MAPLRTALLAAVLTLLPAAAQAWPHSPTRNVAVSTAAGNQDLMKLVVDGAGNTIVTWRDSRAGSGLEDIYAQRILASGVVDPTWPVNGLAICAAADAQAYPSIASDGAGGAVIAWQDRRGGANDDIYAHHVLASGALDPAWPATGRVLCNLAGNQTLPAMVSDGAGGAIVVWQDYRGGATCDLYAMRVLASGAVDPAWTANGRALSTAVGDQLNAVMLSDGAGGAIVGWEDRLNGASNSDIYAQRVRVTGALGVGWPANGRAICTASSAQTGCSIVSDGAGGAILAWTDPRTGIGLLVIAQHVSADGVVDPAWVVNGNLLCGIVGQSNASIVSDGAGGAIVAWDDSRGANFDVYATRLRANGTPDPAWPVNGRAITKAASDQRATRVITDGAGGAIVAWWDFRDLTANHVYAQRVLATGEVDPAWPADGRAVCLAPNGQSAPVIGSDGAGGAILAWQDGRDFGNDIFAQNITTFGVLGSPPPVITSVADLANDQGGRVRIRWTASQMDTFPAYEIGEYGIWRQVSEGAALRALAQGARLAAAGEAAPPAGRVFRSLPTASGVTWWEGIGVVAAHGFTTYSFVAETFADSTGAGTPWMTFLVSAHAALQIGWWDSAPVAGYSVDNLAPAAPAPFTGQYVAGAATLHWNPNAESDLAGYRLYRGATPAFVPGPGNLVAALTDTGYSDPAGAPYVYKLTAVDLHGNESPVATLQFQGSTAVDDGPAPATLSFAAPAPNPSSAACALRFTLPAAAVVKLAVYDAAGRQVRVLAAGVREAGEHAERWDLRDGAGRVVEAGLYFAQLDVSGRRLVRRIAVTH